MSLLRPSPRSLPGLARLCALVGLVAALVAFTVPSASAQLLQQREDFRNNFRFSGPLPLPGAGSPGTTSPLNVAFQLQGRSGTAFGGWTTTRIVENGVLLAGLTDTVSSGPLVRPSFRPTAPDGTPIAGQGVVLAGVRLGRPVVARSVSFSFGSVITPPEVFVNGVLQENFYDARPDNAYLDEAETVPNPDFYWSPHARKVYAVKAGVIEVEWRESVSGVIKPETYVVSTAPARRERTIYWTENGFNGPRVSVPTGLIQEIKIVYNDAVPETVSVPHRPWAIGAIDPSATVKAYPTFYYDQGLLRAYNREGRVFVEYLGAPRSDGARDHLGYDIVNIVREVRPERLLADLGDYLRPPAVAGVAPSALRASVAAGLSSSTFEPTFLYQHFAPNGVDVQFYAVRETSAVNQVLVHWVERTQPGLSWPVAYAEYQLIWPGDEALYSQYLRPADPEESSATAVTLDVANTPLLQYQDDPDNKRVSIGAGGTFVAKLDAENPSARALIRHTIDGEIWFERVQANLHTNEPALALTVDVGTEILPPEPGLLVGYIHPAAGTAYNPATYKNPFAVGFAAAADSAIIGVNAIHDPASPAARRDQLEVWWYRRSTPPSPAFSPSHWPARRALYTLRWPEAAPAIVLASNAGSGDLPADQAVGRIYFQNDPALPGYNPNEEHALMLNGRAWALRDDLNLPTSSEPHVLLDYTRSDGRPAMRVFRILREDDTHVFHYEAEAGKRVQAPMPLPLLPVPLNNGRPVNQEIEGVPDLPLRSPELAATPADFARYDRFTFTDRKGAVWVYRGPHASPAPETEPPSFAMRWFYQTLPGFYFPGLATQPPVGTITPYLRPRSGESAPAPAFVGDPVTGSVPATGQNFSADPVAQPVVFTPSWPAIAPELRLGETLTLPKNGLPAMDGQTSVEILYQQSVALDAEEDDFAARRRSAVLHDYQREKRYPLTPATLSAIPAGVVTTQDRGKVYFSGLPPHLKERLYFDPLAGASGSLVFAGSLERAAFGESYVQLNVLSAADLAAARALLPVGDPGKTQWDAALAGLSATVETFREDETRRGTYIVNSEVVVDAVSPIEITDSDTAVSAYALTATGGGSGYVVAVTGNGRAFTPEAEPVSLHVLRVTDPLYRGELKVVAPSNPLDEKLTLQFTGDFAARPEDYDFEWRYSPPVDGVPPALLSLARQSLVGDEVWRLHAEPVAPFDAYREPGLDGGDPVTLAVSGFVARDTDEPVPAEGEPDAILTRDFTIEERPQRLFLSLDIGPSTGVVVYLNDLEQGTYGVPGRANADAVASFPPLSPLPLLFELNPAALKLGANVLSVDVYSTAAPGAINRVNVRLEGLLSVEDLTAWLPLPDPAYANSTPGGHEIAKVRHVIEGNSLLTLTDNYFILRYRPNQSAAAGYAALPPEADGGWSPWTQPQLAEGWIKRVLAGINPFQQRVNDLYNFEVNTDVSLVAQAGARWEGDVALSLDNINDVGLIPIYETVLRRSRALSIDGTPPINYAGANDALLLAAGYLNDLYMILGNEAYADASDPTIAIDPNSGGTPGYSEVSTSLFSFRGVVPSVLEEELALVRGRDDSLQPGTRLPPVYNRLVWNYTRGIDSGEVIYALNYNILDQNQDGQIDAEDAARLYPQGHGDAYGHYLTALKNYYGLLRNPNFSWTPRTEAVLVLGQPVQVDYFDERKFSAAAAALAKTGQLAVELTYRQVYQATDQAGWEKLRDDRTNPATGRTRYWGADEWASRAGQGAYFNWITAQSLLPEVHPNPAYEGIQKIDRTTVPELREIAAQGSAIQRAMEKADSRLNPLGLSAGALSFDYDPQLQSKPPFEQIYDRAVGSLQNAVTAFQAAERASRALRQQETSLDAQRAAISSQETAFTNRLIELYGTPYSDDIGVGKTYPEGYAGPDLIHAMYVDITEDITGANLPERDETYTIFRNLKSEDNFIVEDAVLRKILKGNPPSGSDLPGISDSIRYTVSKISGEFVKPSAWTGRRASPGKIQTSVSNHLLARQDLQGLMYDYDRLHRELLAQMELFKVALEAHEFRLASLEQNNSRLTALESVNTSFTIVASTIAEVKTSVEDLKWVIAGAAPVAVGLAVDVSPPVDVAVGTAVISAKAALTAQELVLKSVVEVNKQLISLYDRLKEIEGEHIAWFQERAGLRDEMRKTIETYGGMLAALDRQLRVYDQALRDLDSVAAEGRRILAEREAFRKRAAALVQGQRTRDFAFRAFRNEALEKYHQLFDLAAQYTYLAARTYDYETGLLDASGNSTAADFFARIVRARALGVVANGVPQFTSASTGDPGLAGILAALNADWSVARTRLGFNNPDRYRTTFSLRRENYRLLPGPAGDQRWRDQLSSMVMRNVLDDPDVRRFALQVAPDSATPVPGIVIPFETVIAHGLNFFGRPLAGGDSTFSPSSYSTKIRSSGIAFAGYVGMAGTTSTSGTLADIGATSPTDPSTSFDDPLALSATPYVYLVPAGFDLMRAPPINGVSSLRGWQVEDQAIPFPINIAGTDFSALSGATAADSLSEPPYVLRKHQAFRAIAAGLPFYDQPGFTNSRLIGRSAWNTRWKLVIPGNTLLANPELGVARFIDSVKDIHLYFETYSHAGN